MTRFALSTLIATLLCAYAPWASAEPLSAPQLDAHVASLSKLLQMRRGAPLPPLTQRNYIDMSEGHGVLLEGARGDDGLVRATYFRVVDVAAWRLWLALSDSDHHEEFMPYVRESAVIEQGGGTKLAYQFMALPAGTKPRHWIIRSWDNSELWEASGRTLWETHWTLEPGAEELVTAFLDEGLFEKVTVADIDDAVYTVTNEGYWLLVALSDDSTLVAYQAVSDIGGKIPTWLVNELGPAGLKKLVSVVEVRARAIEDHFGADRTPPPAPDGGPVKQLSPP